MKSIAEILLNIKDDPEKERLRQKFLDEARTWEESELHSEPPRALVAEDPILMRVRRALPQLNAAQRRMLETLLDSWEM